MNRGAVFYGTSRMADREASPIPLEIRARLAELELELSEGKELIKQGRKKRRLPLPLSCFRSLSRYHITATIIIHIHTGSRPY